MNQNNVNVSGRDGLYYVHYDSINQYHHKNNTDDVRPKHLIPAAELDNYELDLPLSQAGYDLWLNDFRKAMRNRYPSFEIADHYEKAGKRLILQSKMFQVIIEDNVWSFAVELISRPKCRYKEFQKHLFPSFFKGMREILLTMTDTLYVRSGSWTAEPFTKNEQDKIDDHIQASRIKLDPRMRATCADNDRPQKGAPHVENSAGRTAVAETAAE